jgi:hypothetical protein
LDGHQLAAQVGTDSYFVDDNLGAGDAVQISVALVPAFGYTGVVLSLSLRQMAGTLFSNTNLPAQLSLDDFDAGGCGGAFGPCMRLTGHSNAGSLLELNLTGSLTHLATEAVPEPSALLLTGAGFVAACAVRRRRRRQP